MRAIAVTIGEATRVTGVGRTTIYKLIREGRLESVKVGARRLVTTKSIWGLFGGEDEAAD